MKNLINICLFAFLIIAFYSLTSEYNAINTVCCLVISLYSAYKIISSYQVTLRPSTFFIFAFFIVNWQMYIDLLLGNTSILNPVFINPNTINKGVILATLSLLSLSFAYNNYHPYKEKQTQHQYSPNIQTYFSVIQVFFFLYWASSLSLDDFTGQSYLTSGSFDNDKKGYQDILFNTSQIISLAYFLKNKTSGYKEFLLNIPKEVIYTSVLYALIKLMSGDRGGAIWTIMLYFSAILYSTRKAPKVIYVVLVAFIGSFIMTSISFSRALGNQLSFFEKITFLVDNKQVFSDRYFDITFSPATRELANSLMCSHIALDEIENNNAELHYGKFHFCYSLNMLPFVGSSIIKELNIDRLDKSSSEYVTVIHNGENYVSGLGTTMVADNYLEFGLISLIFAFMIVAMILKIVDYYFVNKDNSDTPAWIIILILSVSCYAISMPRGYFMFYMKYYFYALILYGLVTKKIK